MTDANREPHRPRQEPTDLNPTVHPAGPHSLLVTLGSNTTVHALAAATRAHWPSELEEVIPGDDSLLIIWPERTAPPKDATAQIQTLLDSLTTTRATTAAAPTITIPVTYDGPDLQTVAADLDLTQADLIARHTAPTYTAAFIGFAPGFAYLTGGDPLLNVPRRDEPRTNVPAGAVAIAAGYSAIYPTAGPGGWQLIGHTDLTLFDPTHTPPVLIEPGAQVRFEATQ